MSPLSPFRKKDRARAAHLALLLRSIRTRRVLEAMPALSALLEDGREKLRGEYILDRHYVESLSDEAFERVAEMVHETCLLVEEGGAELYRFLDDHRVLARRALGDSFAEEDDLASSNRGREQPAEPEYDLLARVLEWVDDGRGEEGESLMALAGRVVAHLLSRDGEAPSAARVQSQSFADASGQYHHQVDVVRLDRSSDADDSGEGEDGEGSHAWRLFCRDARESSAEARTPVRRWVAEIGDEHVSLRSVGAPLLRLEARSSGAADADFLFLYAERASDLVALAPAEFTILRGKQGMMAWTQAAPSDETEPALTRLGRIIFSEPASGPSTGPSPEDPRQGVAEC